MSFFADKQTLEDLGITGRHKFNSIFRMFDKVVTNGGRKLLGKMFREPLLDAVSINTRSDIFNYFAGLEVSFPFTGEEADALENYLCSSRAESFVSCLAGVLWKKCLQIVTGDSEYEQLNKDVCLVIELLNRLGDFNAMLPEKRGTRFSGSELIKNIFSQKKLKWLEQEKGKRKLSLYKLLKYDHSLKTAGRGHMKELINEVFKMDVYFAVSKVGKERGFCYAEALPRESDILKVEDLYHPGIEQAIGNNLSLEKECNAVFLTGSNMAGKSTLMKALGISLYLAHMGFPISAKSMRFSVKDGLFSTINIPDNLALGYSHFYAEVQRVKTVALEVAAGKDLVMIFDELFKGTNVKDAYEATLSIATAFSECQGCFFLISSHITEVASKLQSHSPNFRFVYLPTIMHGHKPRYTYQLIEGITSDKQGMIIIQNEGILDILNGSDHPLAVDNSTNK